MKVLWTTNLIPSAAADRLNREATVLGGWVESMIGQLADYPDIELAVACKTDGAEVFSKLIDGVRYYSLNYFPKSCKERLESRCNEILAEFRPDLIQIEGTEFLHARVMQDAGKKNNIKTVVSLQGILNGQYAYQCGELQMDDMLLSVSWSKLAAAWVLHLRKTKWYRPRMKTELAVLENAERFMGRTTWDRAHCYSVNPNAKYYSCNRVLRPPFYGQNWTLDSARRHSIYVGNGYHALKGLHFMLEAMPQILAEYPDTHLYVGGYPPYKEHDKRPFYKKGYAMYIKKLISDFKLESSVTFTGPLKADEVAKRLAETHIYVLCSTVENSPNTLGEAMLVGTPCVAAYVGGVSDMATDGRDALFFRSGDPSLLAWQVKRIFDDDELAMKLSENAKAHAEMTHDPKRNAERLVSIYRDIMNE